MALGRRGLALAIDASDADQVRAAVARAQRELGPLDGAVAVAAEGAAALDALRAALGGGAVLSFAPSAHQRLAFRQVATHIFG